MNPPPLDSINKVASKLSDHGPERAWVTYFYAALFLLPSTVFCIFSSIVHWPRISKLWEGAGLAESKAQWLIHFLQFSYSMVYAISNHFYIILAIVTLALVILELRINLWRGTLRKPVLMFLSAVVVCFVLLLLTAATTTASLVAPIFAVKAAEASQSRTVPTDNSQ